MLAKLVEFDIAGDGEIATEDAELGELSVFFGSELYTGFMPRRAGARFKRAEQAIGADGVRARLLKALAISQGMDEDLRVKVGIARNLFPKGIGERDRISLALSTPEAARLAAAWAPNEVVGWLQVFVDLKDTPEDFDFFFAAARALSTRELEDCIKNPIARQLVDFDGAARADGRDGALRLDQAQWLQADTDAAATGADTPPPAESGLALL